MLVLSRREGEKIVFPEVGVTLEVLRIKGNAARLGVVAPEDVTVLRAELEESLERMSTAARRAATMPREVSHSIRNRLNTASLALHLLKGQLADGWQPESDQTFAMILRELEALSGETEAASNPAPAAAKSHRALVVDDNANERQLLAGFLRMSGYEVDTAGDGCAALDYLASHAQPDVVLLDMVMPRCDGKATIRAIRKNPKLGAIKVFAISGDTQDQWDLPGGRDGVDRWFHKPLRPESFIRELSRELSATA